MFIRYKYQFELFSNTFTDNSEFEEKYMYALKSENMNNKLDDAHLYE